MAGINIPGVSDKYKTSDLVESLMKVERIPLTREQENLDHYKEQQTAWRALNSNMVSLQTSTKSLFSFDNPFNNKLTNSTDERAITATAGRDAKYESFKIDVISIATSDRFMSKELEKDYIIPKGTYTFQIDDKKISFKWNGGKISDFISSLNRRGNGLIKASTVGMNDGKVSLLIESLKTGEKNKLEFKDDALSFAKEVGIVGPVKPKGATIGTQNKEILEVGKLYLPIDEQNGIPNISEKAIFANEKGITVPPRSGFAINLPENLKEDAVMSFTIDTVNVDDITNSINEAIGRPTLPDAGSVEFEGISILNEPSETALPFPNIQGPISIIEDDNVVYVRMKDGLERIADKIDILEDKEFGTKTVTLNSSDYSGMTALVIRNRNTGKQIQISPITIYDKKTSNGFAPINPVSTAGDAEIKYEGITIHRSENSIDDVVPSVTLKLKNTTTETATISITPDTDSAKTALIDFVGKYNQTIAEINILSQNKPELIDELEYLSENEKETKQKELGMFLSDFSLTNAKTQFQRIVSSQHRYSEDATITMLEQIGISTNASGGGGYSPARLRGYLEIDEKKLDNNLETNLDSIKRLFGYDSDGDLIIDSGIGYLLDRQLTSYVQSGGIISSRTGSLDKQIKNSESKIARLEIQLDQKESELRQKYGQMESTLNSLENQQNSILNFSDNLNKSK